LPLDRNIGMPLQRGVSEDNTRSKLKFGIPWGLSSC
jgi:hypothetical protein